jgi:hypothetical protein
MIFNEIRISFNSTEVYLSTVINGKLNNVNQKRNDIFIQVSTSKNRYKIDNSYNYKYSPPNIKDFLKINDKIVKHKCSDTLFVERNDEVFYFIIGDYLYNNPERTKEFKQQYNLTRSIINERNDCDK